VVRSIRRIAGQDPSVWNRKAPAARINRAIQRLAYHAGIALGGNVSAWRKSNSLRLSKGREHPPKPSGYEDGLRLPTLFADQVVNQDDSFAVT